MGTNVAAKIPRGVRNHNPGNIDRTTPRAPWQGRVPDSQLTDPRFEQFTAPEWGIRALARTLITYQDKHGLRTVRGIIDRWAPPPENNTWAYITAVSNRLGLLADDEIDVHDYRTLRVLVEAIIKHENGQQPYSAAVIDHGLRLAGVVPSAPKPMAASKTVIGTAVAATAGAAPEVVDTLQPALADAGVALEPFAAWSPWIRVLVTVLVIAGAALAIYGRLDVRRRTGA
jgi:hypothetical protein